MSRILLLSTAAVLACAPGAVAARSNAPVPALQRINDAAQRCWVKSRDKAFRNYRVVPELDTRVGRPRILVIRSGRSAGLPEMVIEVVDGSISVYGPLQQSPLAARINRDVLRWGNGNGACKG